MKQFLVLTTFLGSVFSISSKAQTLIFEENFTAGIPASWYVVDQDGFTPVAPLDSFDNAWISFADASDTCAASTSYYTNSGAASDYLISPRITIDSFTKLVWSARSYDASYPDSYYVLISTTDSLPGSFTDTVFTKDQELYYWQKRSVQLDLEGYANEDIFVAFQNITTDGYILLIDDVKVYTSDFAGTAEEESPVFSLYPNPATTVFNLTNASSNTSGIIRNIQGELVKSFSGSSVNIEDLVPGVYFVEVSSDESTRTLRLLVQ